MADYNYSGEGTLLRLFTRLKTLLGGYLRTDQLQTAVDAALAQAKESGEFDGADGDDYILTDADKTEIAELAAELVDVSLLTAIGSGVIE